MNLFRVSVLFFSMLLLSYSAEAQRNIFGRRVHNHLTNSNSWRMHERTSLTANIGLSTYYGDLCDKFSCMQFRPNFGVGALIRVAPHWHARLDVNYFRLSSRDVWEKRNLGFRSGNLELFAAGQFDYYEYTKHFRKRKLLNPYGFMGLGVCFFYPRGQYDGKWYYLRKHQTEGVRYGQATVIIPVGIGVRIKFQRHLDFMAEAGYRFTFTDYLDDVSSKQFKPKDTFDDEVSAGLSNRSSHPNSHRWQRGNPDKNDGYFIFQVKARYTFISNIAHFRAKHPKFLRKH
ncbi:MAG: DUF6089 family protein [Cytophagaceae bacterium]